MLSTLDRSPVESILTELMRCKAHPLVAIIHSGPHGQIHTAFTPAQAAYVLRGCMAPQTLSFLTILRGQTRIYIQ